MAHYLVLTKLQTAAEADMETDATAAVVEAEAVPAEQPESVPVTRQRKNSLAKPAGSLISTISLRT